MKRFVIIEDTRQQVKKHGHIGEYFEREEIPYIRQKLFVGDYTRLDNQTLAIDTKKDVIELSGNICGADHDRFRRELLRAKEFGIKLVFLVEEEIEDLARWESPKRKDGTPLTRVSGETLKKAIETIVKKYDVSFEFIPKEKTAKRIVELLGGC